MTLKRRIPDGFTQHVVPKDLPQEDLEQIFAYSARAVEALGVEGCSRVDLRYDQFRSSGERVYVLEVNALPGLTEVSITPDIGERNGMSFTQLIEWIVLNPKWPESYVPAIVQDGICLKVRKF